MQNEWFVVQPVDLAATKCFIATSGEEELGLDANCD